MRKIGRYLVLLALSAGVCGGAVQAFATHISQPIVTDPKTQYAAGETVMLHGWVNYNDQAAADVLLNFKVTRSDGSVAADQSYPSDREGRFEFSFDTRTEKPGAYQITVTSHCLEIHRYACTYKNQTVMIQLKQ
ncbi:MAG: hypothetical protein LZF61_04710 [Nitrosomonas sp.]|nr:MAG: hypothetical protein LZF61_04710 [Nitrosomonas sp.]